MAERQETSVMVSIQEILRDAQHREEQEKIDAERRAREEEQRRADEQRRRQEEEQERLRAQEAERQRKAFEEQKRQAELQALQEAALQRAKMEAESQARLAELTARQAHEQQLHALSQDKSKKRLQLFLVGLGILLFALAIGGGVMIKQASDRAAASEAYARQLESDKKQAEDQESKLKAQLVTAKSQEEVDAISAQLKKTQDDLAKIQDAQKNGAPTVRHPVTGGGGAQAKPAARPGVPCNCTPGDPLCSCL
jgi:colicin import membrane protein